MEPRHRLSVLRPDRLVVVFRLLNGTGLLRAHRERLVVSTSELHAGTQLGDRRSHVVGCAPHPLPGRAEDRVLKALVDQPLAHIGVTEHGPVVALSKLIDMQRVHLLHLTLRLADTCVHVRLGCLPYLEQPRVPCRRIVRRPRIDAQPCLRLLREELVDVPGVHQPSDSIGLILDSMYAISSSCKPYLS